jgi:ribonuclease P protein component
MKNLNYSPLKGFNSFSKVFSISKKFRSEHLLIGVCFKPTDILVKGKPLDDTKIYVGISVPKKYFKKAVIRNRIKRLIKETFRAYIKDTNRISELSKVHIITINWYGKSISKEKDIKLNEVKTPIFKLLDKILKINITINELNIDNSSVNDAENSTEII